jgi:hypothetical protein
LVDINLLAFTRLKKLLRVSVGVGMR